MARHDDLGGGGHTHCITTQQTGGTDFRGGLVLGAVAVEIHALPQVDTLLLGGLPRQLLQAGGVQVGGVWEAYAKFRQILTPERRFGEHLDVVGDEHQLSGLPIGTHASGGVGDNQGLAAQQTQHPHGVSDLLIGITLVVVHPSLHHRHIFPFQSAKHQLSLVAGGGGGLEVGDLTVGHHDGILHLVTQVTQTGAKHHGHIRNETIQAGVNISGALLILFKCKFHLRILLQ